MRAAAGGELSTKVLFTPSARNQLLELVVRLRDHNRERAIALVNGLDERLLDLAGGQEGDGQEAASKQHDGAGGLSLWYWHRAGVLWVLAIGPAALDTDPASWPHPPLVDSGPAANL